MAEAQGIDPTQISPEEFAALVSNVDDGQLHEAISGVGTEQVLDRVFEGMQERFRPDRAQDVDARIQWIVTDDGDEYPYATSISGGRCEISKGSVEDPKVALTTDIVSFAKLVTGNAQGPQLFMTGKLKVSGDLMFSQRITGFFDQPRP